MQYCLCGCGKLRKSRGSNRTIKFYIKGHNFHHKRTLSQFKKGYRPYNYKGKTITQDGYVFVAGHHNHPHNNRGRIFEHVLIMENILGRYLWDWEIVHHKNGIRTDNRPENLEVMARSDHSRYHAKQQHKLTIL